MKIAIIGKGNVGTALGQKWLNSGHEVIYGTTSPSNHDEATPQSASESADVIVLAVPSSAFQSGLLDQLHLNNKVVIDCTNPIKPDFSGLDQTSRLSSAQMIQANHPTSKVAKAFNTIGFNIMKKPNIQGKAVPLLVAADEEEALETTKTLAGNIGFDPVPIGGLEMARHLESIAWVWITLAIKSQNRDFAFMIQSRSD